jgi:hypothetical protein
MLSLAAVAVNFHDTEGEMVAADFTFKRLTNYGLKRSQRRDVIQCSLASKARTDGGDRTVGFGVELILLLARKDLMNEVIIPSLFLRMLIYSLIHLYRVFHDLRTLLQEVGNSCQNFKLLWPLSP